MEFYLSTAYSENYSWIEKQVVQMEFPLGSITFLTEKI
jgi:hypothetical protein